MPRETREGVDELVGCGNLHVPGVTSTPEQSSAQA